MKIVIKKSIENVGFYEILKDDELLISSDNLKGLVLNCIEVKLLLEEGYVLIEDEKRIDSIVAWSMFL